MNNRKRIKKYCAKNSIKIHSLNYIRESVAVPEELISVGWFLVWSDNEYPDDTRETTGDVDDVISWLDYELGN